MSVSLEKLAQLSHGRVIGDGTVEVNACGLDSASLPEGALFAALPGTRVHGAQFVGDTKAGAVLTDAPVTTAQAQRLAMTAHDGIARAVRPAHSPLDGDTIFALSPAQDPAEVDMAKLCAAAADVVEEAIVTAVTAARPGLGLRAYRDLLG